MRCEIREAGKRCQLDRRYLEAMKPKLHGCPKCGKVDGLKVKFNMECNVFMYCQYQIECTNCGYIQRQKYDDVSTAVKALEEEAFKSLDWK